MLSIFRSRNRSSSAMESAIREVATRVRRRYENATGGDENLGGYCARASVQLWIECEKLDIPLRIVMGDSHVFCCFDGEEGSKIVDVTATQFSTGDLQYPPVYIDDIPDDPPPWHAEVNSWYSLPAMLMGDRWTEDSAWVVRTAEDFEHEMTVLDSGRRFRDGLPFLQPGSLEHEMAVTAAAARVRRAFELMRHDGDGLGGMCGRATVQFRIEAMSKGVRDVSIVRGEGHAFCCLSDGRIVDVTATQFNGLMDAPKDGYARIVISPFPADPPYWYREQERWDSLLDWMRSDEGLYTARHMMYPDRAKVLATSI